MKDAAASSIYGSRASFGVILIKTKGGKAGKTNVSYSGNVRFTDALQIPEMMDSYQFAQYFNAAAANAGQSPVFSADVMQRIQDYQAGKITTVSTPILKISGKCIVGLMLIQTGLLKYIVIGRLHTSII